MIDKEKIRGIVLQGIEHDNILLVDIQVNSGNSLKIVLDSLSGVTIEDCARISRLIESQLDREVEDFELEVTSYSISEPFILPLHYQKNLDKTVEIYLKNGKSVKGILKNVELTTDNKDIEQIEVLVRKKVQSEGKKRKIEVDEIVKLSRGEIQKAKLLLVI